MKEVKEARLNVRMPQELKEKIDGIAKQQGVSSVEMIRRVLEANIHKGADLESAIIDERIRLLENNLRKNVLRLQYRTGGSFLFFDGFEIEKNTRTEEGTQELYIDLKLYSENKMIFKTRLGLGNKIEVKHYGTKDENGKNMLINKMTVIHV